jgi:myo-inositol-1(or 4)-monophosphatase
MTGEHLAVELMALAEAVAREAGELVRTRRAERTITVSATKTSPTDIVTESDHASEALIRRRLLQTRVADGFLGEEGNAVDGSSGVLWVVDPIDGTVNYLYDIPAYAVSIAAVWDGETVAGVVHVPATRETWTATRGGGAFLNGRPIGVSHCAQLSQALIGTGFSYEAQRRAAQARVVTELLPRVRDIRRIGSAAIDLCQVASGRLDGYYEHGLAPWDRAAGVLVATEAGAVVVGPSGLSQSEEITVAAGPELFPQLSTLLTELGA